MHRLWSRLTYANVMATIAVFISLGGSSWAVLRITGRNVKDNSLTTRDIRNHSLLRRDFRRGQLLRGHRGHTGAKGLQGDPGPLVNTLPSGKTEFGKYYALDNPAPSGQFAIDVVSFQFPLPSLPADHYLPPGTPPSAECPGSPDDPRAAPGHLCVYSKDRQNVQTTYDGDGINFDKLDTHGFAVNIRSSGTANTYFDYGSWAVTAP